MECLHSVPVARSAEPEIEKDFRNHFYVTSILNGPLCFAIQMKTVKEQLIPLLTKLINDQQCEKFHGQLSTTKKYLSVFPGSNNILHRIRVTNIFGTTVSVTFIDFGIDAKVGLSDIYDVPNKLEELKPLAMYARLDGLTNELLTLSARTKFINLVENKIIYLKFTEHEPCHILRANVYIDEDGTVTNIKEKLLTCEEPTPNRNLKLYRSYNCNHYSSYEQRKNRGSENFLRWKNHSKYEKGATPRIVVENVTIQHVESLNKVFVILNSHITTLTKLMANLANYGTNAMPNNILHWKDLYPGMPVCALFSDMSWNRALIADYSSDIDEVTVNYMDYGNQDKVSLKYLLKLPPELFKLGPFIIQCELDLQSCSSRLSNVRLVDVLRPMITGKSFIMHVYDMNELGVPLVHLKMIEDNRWLPDIVADDMFHYLPKPLFHFKYPYNEPAYVHSNDIELERLICVKPIFEATIADANETIIHIENYLRSDDIHNKADSLLEKTKDIKSEMKELNNVIKDPKLRGRVAIRKFIDSTYEVGACCRAFVMHFDNPSSFYVHITSEAFRELEASIQYQYRNKQPLPKKEVKEGLDVIAESELDGMLYRARILTVKKREITVQLVDYGNVVKCSFDNIWQVRQHHTELPLAAIHCGLRNLIPSNGILTWDVITMENIKNIYFSEYEFTLKILKYHNSLVNSFYEVELLNEFQEKITHCLIDDGYARIKISEEPVNLDYLINQKIMVYVIKNDSPEELYVNFEPEKMELLENRLKEMQRHELTNLPSEDVIEGIFCLVSIKKKLRRAIILHAIDETKIRLRYVDHGGDDELPFGQLYSIPESLLIYNGLATKCNQYTLRNECILENEFTPIYVIGQNQGSLSITTLDGASVEILKSPVLRPVDAITVSHLKLNEDGELIAYVRSTSTAILLKTLENSLEKFYELTSDTTKLSPFDLPYYRVGTMCALKTASFGSNRRWYRSRILSNVNDVITLYCVDYGFNLTVRASDDLIRPLDRQFYRPHELCLETRTGIRVNSIEGKKKNKLRQLKNVTAKVQFAVQFERDRTSSNHNDNDNEWRIVFFRTGDNRNLLDYAKSVGFDFWIESPSNRAKTNLLPPIMEEDSRFCLNSDLNLTIVHAVNPSKFWIRPIRNDRNLFIENDLESTIESSPAVRRELDHYGWFAVKFDQTGRWYRGKVKNNETLAVDIGYENSSSVPLIKSLPYRFNRLAGYAFKCSLDVEPIDRINGWSEFARDVIKNYNHISNVETIFPNYRRSELIVDAYWSLGGDVATFLIERNEARRKTHPVAVSCVNALDEFYVQLRSGSDDLDRLNEQLNCSVCSSSPDTDESTSFDVGDIIAAEFENDWYRAIVVRVIVRDNRRRYEVEFIDYGNRSISDRVRRLPDRLRIIRPFAFKCYLSSTNNYDDDERRWLLDKFRFRAKYDYFVMKRINSSAVKQGRNVGRLIVDLFKEIDDERLSIPILNYLEKYCQYGVSDVRIIHVENGPASFYVRPKNVDEVFAFVEDFLNSIDVDLFELKPDDVIATFSQKEDDTEQEELLYVARCNGKRCRVKLLDVTTTTNNNNNNNNKKNNSSSSSNDDDDSAKFNFSVQAIDYGYRTNVTRLYRMPYKLKFLKRTLTAVQCTLLPPTDTMKWPNSVDRTFAQLCRDADRKYNMTLLTDRLPYIVILNDDRHNSIRNVLMESLINRD